MARDVSWSMIDFLTGSCWTICYLAAFFTYITPMKIYDGAKTFKIFIGTIIPIILFCHLISIGNIDSVVNR